MKRAKQKTFCYCPRCKNELISSDSYIEDKSKNSFYTYFKCKKCGNTSIWDFNPPVPILVSKNLEEKA